MCKICKEILIVLEKLSNSQTARIDAREWVKHFKKKITNVGCRTKKVYKLKK